MASDIEYVNLSERIPIAFEIVAPDGYTDTLAAPVFVTIFTVRRDVAIGGDGNPLQNLAVQRQDGDPEQTSSAVYEFAPGLLGLTTGIYILSPHMDVQAPDNLPQDRLMGPSVRVRVLPDAG